MSLIFNIVVFAVIFLFIITIFTILITRKKKNFLTKKLKEIDKESNLLAIDDLRKLIKKDPDNFEARDKLADLLVNNQSYLSAIKEYLTIIDHSQFNEKIKEVIYLNKIGNVFMLMGNYEDAKKYYLITKSKEDLNVEANIKLGDIEIIKNNFDEAVKNFMILRLSEKYSADAFYILGNIRFNQRKYIQAIEDFNNTLLKGNYKDLDKIAEINYQLAECYLKNHELQKATEFWKKVYDYDPNYKDVKSKIENYSD